MINTLESINNLKIKIKKAPTKSGIYKFLDKEENILYIGKAKNIKKRLASYTKIDSSNRRLFSMLSKINDIETIITENESQALVLEASLIKNLQPKYNILLKDDKSYPYIVINKNHPYPRISKYRGVKAKNLLYFGPFFSSLVVIRLISVIQKTLKIRICPDNVFANRKRPCLEYDVGRCSAPCTKLISQSDYQNNIQKAINLINGNVKDTKEVFYKKMINASDKLQYELANDYKNMILALDVAANKQNITGVVPKDSDVDFIAIEFLLNIYCIQIFFFRNFENKGNQVFSSNQHWQENISDILSTFILQFYQERVPPKKIYVNVSLEDQMSIDSALNKINSSYHNKNKITIKVAKETNKTMQFVINNTKEYLNALIEKHQNNKKIFDELGQILNIQDEIDLLEVYDNSHNFGDCPIGAIIAVDRSGFVKKMYKKFNINNATDNDYAMLEEVLTRRISKIEKGQKPDVLIIDGGLGHVGVVNNVMTNLGIHIPFLCIAKGPNRTPGMEKYYNSTGQKIDITNTETLYFLQRIRDEAHRFAITTHRKKKQKKITVSILDNIQGLGVIRKKRLMSHFKTTNNIANASIEEIAQVNGMNKKIASTIKEFLTKKQ